MEIRSTEEVMESSYEFALAIIEKQIQIKSIQEEIKEIKENYKEQGIAVSTVNRVINTLKTKAKKDDSELLEEQIILEKMEANQKIQEQIAILVQK